MASEMLMRKLNIDIAGEQAHWLKCRTWFYKWMKKKRRRRWEFKVHHWQYPARWNSQHLRCHKMDHNRKIGNWLAKILKNGKPGALFRYLEGLRKLFNIDVRTDALMLKCRIREDEKEEEEAKAAEPCHASSTDHHPRLFSTAEARLQLGK